MEYIFTLKFKLPAELSLSDDEIMSMLGGAGCTDALVGLGLAGYVGLDFTRDANSAAEAFASAISDVQGALPGVLLVEAGPDFVGLTDIAEVAGVSRQNMRKLFVGYSREFPPPVHGGHGTVWHLAPVLQFMAARKYEISQPTRDVADIAMQLNLSKEAKLLMKELPPELESALASASAVGIFDALAALPGDSVSRGRVDSPPQKRKALSARR